MSGLILRYGVIGGLFVGIVLSVVTITTCGNIPMSLSMAIGYLTMLVAFSTIFLAIKRWRDVEGGGVIRFPTALGIGLGISVVASLVYVTAWEVTQAVAAPDFIHRYVQVMIANEKAAGAPPRAIADLTAQMRQLERDYARPAFRLPMTFMEIFPVGVLVSLVSAALLRNSRFMTRRP